MCVCVYSNRLPSCPVCPLTSSLPHYLDYQLSHTHMHERTHAHTHTHARTNARTHTHTHTLSVQSTCEMAAVTGWTYGLFAYDASSDSSASPWIFVYICVCVCVCVCKRGRERESAWMLSWVRLCWKCSSQIWVQLSESCSRLIFFRALIKTTCVWIIYDLRVFCFSCCFTFFSSLNLVCKLSRCLFFCVSLSFISSRSFF